MEMDNGLLEVVLSQLKERFADGVVSIVLYGSLVRGESVEGSDIDLLVVVPDLPPEWREIFAIEDELARIGVDLGRRLDIRLVEPQAVSYAVTCATPLMLEIYDAHRVLFDPTGFFEAEMRRFAEVMRERGISRLSRGVWRVPSAVHEDRATLEYLLASITEENVHREVEAGLPAGEEVW